MYENFKIGLADQKLWPFLFKVLEVEGIGLAMRASFLHESIDLAFDALLRTLRACRSRYESIDMLNESILML